MNRKEIHAATNTNKQKAKVSTKAKAKSLNKKLFCSFVHFLQISTLHLEYAKRVINNVFA